MLRIGYISAQEDGWREHWYVRRDGENKRYLCSTLEVAEWLRGQLYQKGRNHAD